MKRSCTGSMVQNRMDSPAASWSATTTRRCARYATTRASAGRDPWLLRKLQCHGREALAESEAQILLVLRQGPIAVDARNVTRAVRAATRRSGDELSLGVWQPDDQ